MSPGINAPPIYSLFSVTELPKDSICLNSKVSASSSVDPFEPEMFCSLEQGSEPGLWKITKSSSFSGSSTL